MMARKLETHEEMVELRANLFPRRENGDLGLDWKTLFKNPVGRFLARNILPTVSQWWNSWYDYDFRHGQAGSSADSPIYPSVRAVLTDTKTGLQPNDYVPSNRNPAGRGMFRDRLF